MTKCSVIKPRSKPILIKKRKEKLQKNFYFKKGKELFYKTKSREHFKRLSQREKCRKNGTLFQLPPVSDFQIGATETRKNINGSLENKESVVKRTLMEEFSLKVKDEFLDKIVYYTGRKNLLIASIDYKYCQKENNYQKQLKEYSDFKKNQIMDKKRDFYVNKCLLFLTGENLEKFKNFIKINSSRRTFEYQNKREKMNGESLNDICFLRKEEIIQISNIYWNIASNHKYFKLPQNTELVIDNKNILFNNGREWKRINSNPVLMQKIHMLHSDEAYDIKKENFIHHRYKPVLVNKIKLSYSILNAFERNHIKNIIPQNFYVACQVHKKKNYF